MYAKYFKESEFTCHCCGKGAHEMDPNLLHMLDLVREEMGVPLQITSGYRCEQHNQQVGSKPNSAHCKGKAVDVACSSSNLRMVMVCLFVAHGIKRVGIAKTFIHVDVDDTLPQNVMWLY
jgi:uncharacterized protein YcbK (DUF882 family)